MLGSRPPRSPVLRALGLLSGAGFIRPRPSVSEQADLSWTGDWCCSTIFFREDVFDKIDVERKGTLTKAGISKARTESHPRFPRTGCLAFGGSS